VRPSAWLAALLAAAIGASPAHADNAADRYREALAFLVPAQSGVGGATPVLSDDERRFLRELPAVPTASDRERLAPILAKTAEARAILDSAARIGRCDWQVDRAAGIGLLLPHVGPVRVAADLVRAQALSEAMGGTTASAMTSLATLGAIGAHLAQDDLTISSLVAATVTTRMAAAGDLVLDGGGVDAKQAQSLLDSLGSLKGDDPLRFGSAVRGEWDLVATSLRGPDAQESLDEMLRAAATAGAAPSMTLDQARAELRSVRPLFERAARVLEMARPEDAIAEMRKLASAVEGGRMGPLATLLAPDLERLLARKIEATRELALFLERLRSIAEGKVPPEDLPNAAVFLSRASAGARALDADSQEIVEVLRVAPAALDESRAARAADLLARMDRPVFVPLAEAAACRRCDFRVLRLPEPSLDARLLGGLRGAVRIALADGLRRARAERSADRLAPALVAAWRVAALVAMDPSLSRAAVASTVLAEANVALAEAASIGPMRTATLDELERALARMAPGDPVGFRAATAADARRTVDAMARLASGAVPEAREARERILVQRGASAMLARVAFADARQSDSSTWPDDSDGALVRLTDVYPAAATGRLRAAVAAWDARREQARERGAEPLDGRGLPLAIDPAVPFDLPVDEQRTMFRKDDPVRGVDFVEVGALLAASDAAFVAAGDALRAARARAVSE
jgi:hypothetical protein